LVDGFEGALQESRARAGEKLLVREGLRVSGWCLDREEEDEQYGVSVVMVLGCLRLRCGRSVAGWSTGGFVWARPSHNTVEADAQKWMAESVLKRNAVHDAEIDGR